MSRPLLLAFAAMVVLPGASALMTDSAGDVVLEAETGDVIPVPPGARDLVDLLSLAIEDAPEALMLRVGLAAHDPAAEPDGGTIQVGFTLRDTEFRAVVQIKSSGPIYVSEGAALQRRIAGATSWGEGVAVEAALGAGRPASLEIHIPRRHLTDSLGQPAYRGDALHSFWAQAQDTATQASAVSFVGAYLLGDIVDRMPDEGTEGAYTLVTGEAPAHGLGLFARAPYRASNGERGTLLFEAWAVNLDDQAHDVLFTAHDVPSQWQVDVLVPVARLEPGQERHIPIIASIPFAHAHGTVERFNITMEAIDSAAKHSLDLGVRFLEVPQPAGHHPTVWLHPRFESGDTSGTRPSRNTFPFLSADEGDERSAGGLIAPTYADKPHLAERFGWCIPLSPALEIGLDFTDDAAQLEAAIASGLAVEGDLTAQLLLVTNIEYADFQEETPCSWSGAMTLTEPTGQSVSIEGGSSTPVEIALEPKHDLVPYRRGQNLVLHLRLDLAEPNLSRMVDVPHLLPGGRLDLPLTEYIEQPPTLLGDAAKITIANTSLARRPGTTAVIDITVGGPGERYEVSLVGTNTGWARIWPRGDIRGGEPFALIVDVPDSAEVGDAADLVLRFEDEDGNLILGRVVVAVAGDPALPDDEARAHSLLSSGKKSPGLGALLVVVLAGALRRRG